MRNAILRRYFRHGTLPQLMVFEAVARHASLTRAAEEVHLAQPTVSVQIKKLSETVGMPLFEQVGKKLYLTDAGHALRAACDELLGVFTRAEERLTPLRAADAGPLRLSVTTTCKQWLPRLLGSFCRRHPDVQARLEVGNRQQIVARMARNQDDLYVLCDPPQDLELVTHPLLENPFRVYAPADHRLAGRRAIAFDEIAAEPIVLREIGAGTRRVVQDVFEAHGAEPNVRLELGSDEAIKQAVAGGLGIAVLSQATVGELGPRDGVVMLDVTGFPVTKRWMVAYPDGKRITPTAQLFLDFLLAETAQGRPVQRTLAPAL